MRHTGSVGTLPLLQLVLELTERPVLAAGGIATGRGLAAVLAAGAVGAWIGTPFLLAEEAPDEGEGARAHHLERRDGDDLHERLRSLAGQALAGGVPRPRAARTPFAAEWTGHEDALGPGSEPREAFIQARAAEDYDVAHVYAGQSVGLLGETMPAAAIVAGIEAQAEILLSRW